jgi:2-dehydro-3-deoxygluconokinase
MPRYDVTTFGEMLLRLSVPSGERLETARHLDIHPAGAEANVVTLLSRLSCQTLWMGALPKNPMGRMAANALRSAGVNTEGVLWRESGRMGTYYVEFGALPRGIQVTYDRAHSSASEVQLEDVNWEVLLNTRILHLTGITSALSISCREIVSEAILRAKQAGIFISFDVNYRQKLWSEQEAGESLMPLIKQADLVFCSQSDAGRLFGCSGSKQEIAQNLLEKTQALKLVMSFSEEGVLGWDGTNWHHRPAQPTQIVDRLGAGDALAAGVLYGQLHNDFLSGLRYGTILAAMALSQNGDMVVTTEAEMLALSQQSSILTR